MSPLVETGRRVLREARLSAAVETACVAALTRPGHVFSAFPVWGRLCLAWIEALAAPPHDAFLPAAVACDCMAAGYDLIDRVYDRPDGPGPGPALTGDLPAGVTLLLLAQEILARLALPAERRAAAAVVLARAGRRALAAQGADYAARPGCAAPDRMSYDAPGRGGMSSCRGGISPRQDTAGTGKVWCSASVRGDTPPPALPGQSPALPGQLPGDAWIVTVEGALAILRRRSATLVAATCRCAAILAGAPPRTVALAGRFGRALGCAVQLEDDLADMAEDADGGRRTVPLLLAQAHPDAPGLAEATTEVLIDYYLRQAAGALARLPGEPTRTEALWTLLPSHLRAAALS